MCKTVVKASHRRQEPFFSSFALGSRRSKVERDSCLFLSFICFYFVFVWFFLLFALTDFPAKSLSRLAFVLVFISLWTGLLLIVTAFSISCTPCSLQAKKRIFWIVATSVLEAEAEAEAEAALSGWKRKRKRFLKIKWKRKRKQILKKFGWKRKRKRFFSPSGSGSGSF